MIERQPTSSASRRKRTNQGIRRAVRLPCGNEFSKTFEFALGPLNFDTRQDQVRSHAFQPRKDQNPAFPVRALTHNPVPQFSLRHGPAKQSHGIGQEVGVARELQFFFEQAHRAIFRWPKVGLELDLAPRAARRSLDSFFWFSKPLATFGFPTTYTQPVTQIRLGLIAKAESPRSPANANQENRSPTRP
jgi:hypothetical protein